MPQVNPTLEIFTDAGGFGWRLKTKAGEIAESARRFQTQAEAENDAADLQAVVTVLAPKVVDDGGSQPDWSKGLLGVAGALVVGVLAALGVSGDLLARMVRNSPDAVATPLYILLICGGVLGAVGLLSAKAETLIKVIGLVVTAAVTWALVQIAYVGKDSQETRERPSAHLELVRGDGGTLALTGGATATSLKSGENLLLQVIQLRQPAKTYKGLRGVCTDAMNGLEADTVDYGAENIKVLSWAEVGPDSKGTATTQMAIPLGADATSETQICALAQLNARSGDLVDVGVAWVVLNGVPGDPAPARPASG